MKKALFWFILWVGAVVLGSVYSAAMMWSAQAGGEAASGIANFAEYQLGLLLGFVPLVLIPLLGLSCYYAIKENNKAVKIIAICFLVHHVICVFAVLLQVLGELGAQGTVLCVLLPPR